MSQLAIGSRATAIRARAALSWCPAQVPLAGHPLRVSDRLPNSRPLVKISCRTSLSRSQCACCSVRKIARSTGPSHARDRGREPCCRSAKRALSGLFWRAHAYDARPASPEVRGISHVRLDHLRLVRHPPRLAAPAKPRRPDPRSPEPRNHEIHLFAGSSRHHTGRHNIFSKSDPLPRANSSEPRTARIATYSNFGGPANR